MADANWPVYAEITGPIVMIGFGSIGRGTLPLIERHFRFDKSRLTVIDPSAENRHLLDERGIAFVQESVTKDNYKKLLTPLLTAGKGQGFCINLSVDTGSVDLMHLCRKLGVLYVDTVIEPWLGFYFDAKADNASRTNYALRETLREEKRKHPGGTTAVSTCGANPGMVPWRSSGAGTSKSSLRSVHRVTSACLTSHETMPGLAPQVDTAVGPPGCLRFSSRSVSRSA